MPAQPTPRPWRADLATIYGPNGEVVAVCRQAKPQNSMIAHANARLIVEAANATRNMFACRLDADDARDVNAAIAHYQRTRRVDGEVILPAGESDTAGAILAEICRGWLESQGALRQDGLPE